jgi:hypothetical protein
MMESWDCKLDMAQLFFAGTLVLPIALWIGAIYFYGKYKKEKASPP